MESTLTDFCEEYNLKNLIKVPTCYKNPDNPSCIDLFLTNRPKSFKNTMAIETGISDFHKMVISVLRTKFRKGPPKTILYRDYRRYCHSIFRMDLESHFSTNDICKMSNDEFVLKFTNIFDKYAPIKRKILRCNESPFINKQIRKEIMKRSSLRNRFLKKKTEANKILYNKQRNYCTYLIRKTKKEYYSRLHPSCLISCKKFWKTVKPLFSDKIKTSENITLIENNEIVNTSAKTAELFNSYFSNAVKLLNIVRDEKLVINSYDTDPILDAIKTFEEHPSIMKINQHFSKDNTFSFSYANLNDIESLISSLRTSASYPIHTIPPKIFKEYFDIFTTKLHNDFKSIIDKSIFPSNCKLADVTPTHKKDCKTEKSNYRPISILPVMAKLFEKLLFKQLTVYFEEKYSKFQCGFRKGFSSQTCLSVMIENWKRALDKGKKAGVLLSDLSKAFDCLDHRLLIAKLHAYGCDYKSLKLILSYLQNRFQRVKVNSSFSSWSEILCGVPQGSIGGPTVFNIYLIDLFLFFEESDIANYADDTNPYECDNDMDKVIHKLENDAIILINWVKRNFMKANPDKFHVILSDKDQNIPVKVDEYEIQNRGGEKY